MIAAPPGPVDEWTAWWRDSEADGCTAAFPPQVAAAIRTGWQQLLASLPADASLIDIGCGKGAVLALARARGLSALTGVDAARISGGDPAIMAGIDAASLPFADGQFTVAVSQFGVEYAGLARAVSEAARVARCQVWLLLHASDGPVVGAARELVVQADWLAGDAFPNTSLLEAVWQAAGAQAETPDTAAVAGLAAEVAAWARRLDLLSHAAPDAAAVEACAAGLRQAGWRVSVRDEGAPPAARWLLANR